MTAVAEPRLDPARVRSQTSRQPGFHWLTLELPADYPEVLPGQYLNLRAGSSHEFTFRRPFGVVECRREPAAVVIELYYAVVGDATRRMAAWQPGGLVDCLGPLGVPYRVREDRPALLVAGGRGAAPLLYLNRLLRDGGHASIRFAFGVRTGALLFGVDRLDRDALLLASDDGSVGHHGTVLDAIEQTRPEWLGDEPVIYACGPEALLAATGRFAERLGLDAQVSLEAVYGCGLGLCRGCAVPLKHEARYLMQCIEGPVVDASRVDWDRMPHA
jgi:dihydroorotate dehydrogenase electron transfer subunit